MEIDLLPKQPLFDLTGKKALVTGSSRGLGLVVAQALANQGAKVTLNGRNETRLLVLKEKMKAFGWYCDIFVQDIAANNCIESFHQFCLEKGSPHILVNCVGQRLRQSITNSTDQEIIFHLHTNLNALILLSKHAAIKMQEMGQGGRIINFTSIAGKLARAGDTVYPIAKHGLEALVRSLAVEFGRFNITSNGIAPGTRSEERRVGKEGRYRDGRVS